MTKAIARALAQQWANTDGVVRAVIRHKSKFNVMPLSRAKSEQFYIMEVIKPQTTEQPRVNPRTGG